MTAATRGCGFQSQHSHLSSEKKAVLSVGDFASPGGSLTDYAASFGTAALYVNSIGAIIPAIPESITTDAAGKPYLQKWKAQTRWASITDGTSNTTIFGEKHIRPNSMRGRNEDRSAFSAVRNTHRRMMGRYQSGSTIEERSLDEGKILQGAKPGEYVARIVIADGDYEHKKVAAKSINKKFLNFETSGLSVKVPTSGLTLSISK